MGTEDDGYDNLTFSGRGEYFLTPTAKVFFAARTTDADIGLRRLPTAVLLARATRWTIAITCSMQAAWAPSSRCLTAPCVNTFALQGTKIERDNFSGAIPTGFFDGDRIKGEYKGVLTFNDKLSLLAGADWEETVR